MNEIHNDYVIIPTAKNSLMYRYVDYILEQASYSKNYDLFLYEGLVEQKYFNDFLLYNEEFRDDIRNFGQGVRTLGSNVANDVKQVATGIRTTAQQAKQYYNHELDQVSGNHPPSLANRVQAGVNIAKNIGNDVQQAAGIISNHVKNQYNQQLNRITGGESPSKIAKTKAVGYVAKNYIAKGAGTIIDNTDKALTLTSIDPNNPDIIGTASDLIIPGLPQATAFLLNRRGQLKMGAKMIQIATSEKAAINQKIQDEKAKLSSLSGQAKISCQQTIDNLKQQLNNLMSKNN